MKPSIWFASVILFSLLSGCVNIKPAEELEASAGAPVAEKDGSSLVGASAEQSAPTMTDTLISWLEAHQSNLGKQVTQSASAIDAWGADVPVEALGSNDSYVVVSLVGEAGDLTDNKLSGKLKGRLHLPLTSDRYQLYFNSDDVDNQSLDQQRGPSGGDGVNDSVLGVSIRNNNYGGFEPRIGVGARLGSSLDMFVKFSLSRIDYLSEFWASDWRQSVYYYHQSYGGYRTDWDLYRWLSNRSFIEISNSFKYADEYNFWSNYSAISYHTRDGLDSNLSYEIGLNSDLDATKRYRQNNYFFRFQWRERLYQDWLYLIVTPEINFPEMYNYEATPGIYLELNMIFAERTESAARRQVRPMPELSLSK